LTQNVTTAPSPAAALNSVGLHNRIYVHMRTLLLYTILTYNPML